MSKLVSGKRKADKMQAKAVNTRSKALNTFTTAVSEVERANMLLEEARQADAAEMDAKMEQIVRIEDEIRALDVKHSEKKAQIKDNEELIRRLGKFTVKG